MIGRPPIIVAINDTQFLRSHDAFAYFMELSIIHILGESQYLTFGYGYNLNRLVNTKSYYIMPRACVREVCLSFQLYLVELPIKRAVMILCGSSPSAWYTSVNKLTNCLIILSDAELDHS